MGYLLLLGVFGALIIAFAISFLPVILVWRRKRSLGWVFCVSLLAGWLGFAGFSLITFPPNTQITFAVVDRLLVWGFFLSFPCAAFWTLVIHLFSGRGSAPK
jgi:hypothetical protein